MGGAAEGHAPLIYGQHMRRAALFISSPEWYPAARAPGPGGWKTPGLQGVVQGAEPPGYIIYTLTPFALGMFSKNLVPQRSPPHTAFGASGPPGPLDLLLWRRRPIAVHLKGKP